MFFSKNTDLYSYSDFWISNSFSVLLKATSVGDFQAFRVILFNSCIEIFHGFKHANVGTDSFISPIGCFTALLGLSCYELYLTQCSSCPLKKEMSCKALSIFSIQRNFPHPKNDRVSLCSNA